MWDLKACRICLIMDVKMHDLRNYPLDQYYESIVGPNISQLVELPQYACYECAALILKSYRFRDKCLRAQQTLLDILHKNSTISEKHIKLIDRKKLSFQSNITEYVIIQDSLEETSNAEFQEIKIKEEQNNVTVTEPLTEEFDYSVNIKEEDDEIDIDDSFGVTSPVSSDDDDAPLSFQRNKSDDKPSEIEKPKKPIKKKKKLKAKKKTQVVETDVEVEIPLDIVEKKEEKQIEIEKPRRGRKRKTENVEIKPVDVQPKKRGPKPDRLTRDEADMEEYVSIVKLSHKEQMDEITKRQDSANYKNAPLRCTVCYKGFVDNDAFRNHMAKHDPRAGDIECPICRFRFQTKRTLQKHAANHEKKYACRSCPYISKTTTQAKQHQKWHKGITYKCQYCDEVSTKWTSYLSHVRIKHPSQFICGVCGYSFVSKLGLAMHKTMMHKDQPVEKKEDETEAASEAGPFCGDCDVQFVSLEAFKRHMVTSARHISDNEFGNGCRVCGETFKTTEELRVHHRKEHARKRPKNYGKKPSEISWPINCEHCAEEIPNARDYWTHFRRVHPDKKYPIDKSFMCEICGKGFRGNAFLVYHKRTHFEERMYKCVQCPKSFFNRTNLQMHEKTHSDNRPYPCSVCFKAFKLKGALDRHFRSHTGVKPYECEFCGKAFGQSNSRKLHIRTVHLKQPAPYISRSRLERRRALEAVKNNPTAFQY